MYHEFVLITGHFNKDHKKDLVFTESWLKINKAEIIPFLSYKPSDSSEPTDPNSFMLGLEEVQESGRKTRSKGGR